MFVAIGLVAGGCGDVVNHLADAPVANDVTPIDARAVDAPPPRCDPAKPFGAPVAVAAFSTGADETGVSLTADELTAVFSSTRVGGLGGGDLYIAQRADRTAPWGAPSILAGVNTTGTELRATITGDGLSLYIEYRANANATIDIVRATRATTAAAFGAPALVTGVNGTGDDGQPFVMPDNSALYFMSTRGATPQDDLYVATGNAGSFGTPMLVAGTNLATASGEGYPVVTPDGLALYFRSDRAGNSSFDVWLATRTSVATGFNAPVNVSVLNTAVAEAPNWISADNCVLYMNRNVGTVASNNEIFVATKPL